MITVITYRNIIEYKEERLLTESSEIPINREVKSLERGTVWVT